MFDLCVDKLINFLYVVVYYSIDAQPQTATIQYIPCYTCEAASGAGCSGSLSVLIQTDSSPRLHSRRDQLSRKPDRLKWSKCSEWHI